MAINTEPMFVKPGDFFNYWGVDLSASLKTEDNISNKANIFLTRIERNLMSWIDANTFRNFSWSLLSEYQKENFQLAVLEQAMYVFRNGDISMDSGYDIESGQIISKDELNKIYICETAKNYLKMGGLFNTTIPNKYRYTKIIR